MTGILRLALQKSGRLFDDSFRLLAECGIDLESNKVTLKTKALNFPLEVYLVRDDDIPAWLSDGVADVGIVGRNTVEEQGHELNIVQALGFGRCRLSVAVPKTDPIREVRALSGKRIATSHPRILGRFLQAQGIQAEIHKLSGSVEIAPSIGLADAICDLVSTGSTLATNGLQEVEVIFRSEAVLVAGALLDERVKPILDELHFRMQAVRRAQHTKYIMLNAPDASLDRIIALIPGAKSPSVLPLAMTGWSSVHSVVEEDAFWEVIGALKNAGAEGILVVPIEKMIQ